MHKYIKITSIILIFLASANSVSAIVPSDLYYDEQWYLKKINASEAWNITSQSPDTVIAVIDSGVDIDHPDLEENIWLNTDEIPDNGIDDDKNGYIDDVNGWDFVNDTSDPRPKFEKDFNDDGINHGTLVAGIIAAQGDNAAGIAGITWRAKIMPLKVLDDSGEGNTLDVIRAIDYAIANGAQIINFSFVGSGYSENLNQAVKRAYDAGIIIVAAAGNEDENGQGSNLDVHPAYPVCHDGPSGENWVIGVAAVDTLDQKGDFSSYGSACIDIAAPGVSFFGTVVYQPGIIYDGKFFDKYYDGYWSGTSMAAPVVSGAAALLLETNPNLSSKEVREILLSSADNINRLNLDYIGELGSGRLNLESAVAAAKASISEGAELLISPASSKSALVKETDLSGNSSQEFFAYQEEFTGGASIASGDVNGDGKMEIITGAGAGGGPHVKVFDLSGNLISQFFAYDKNFRGGVNVAVGDINGDGVDEIVTGVGNGGGPHIRIFDSSGKVLGQFFAYDKNFRGGVNVAVGDTNGDGVDEIVAGAGVGGGPHVRVFDNDGKVLNQFFAYETDFRGGVNVAVGNVSKANRGAVAEIITAPASGMEPKIKVFNENNRVIYQFSAYNINFKGGVNLASADVDADGLAEIVTGAGATGGPHVRVFEANGTLINSFYAYETDFAGGVKVGVIEE